MALPLEIMNCFEILGVAPGAHPGEIRAAFRRLALSFHPDVAGPGGSEKFEAIAAAYSILKTATPEQMAEALKRAKKRPSSAPKKSREGSPFRWGRRAKKEAPPTKKKKCGKKEEKKAEEQETNSARVRELLLERALVEAELAVARLLEKSRGEDEAPAKIAMRLLGDHPEVRLMALRSLLGRAPEGEIFSALLEMARRRPVDDEALELMLLIDLGPEKKKELARALASRFPSMSEKTALALLRRLTLLPGRGELLVKALLNPSARVIASALASWPPLQPLPDELVLIRLLRRDEEAVLVPLLRMLKSAGIPPWAGPRIAALSEKHSSPAVRVWAGSIVRSGNLL